MGVPYRCAFWTIFFWLWWKCMENMWQLTDYRNEYHIEFWGLCTLIKMLPILMNIYGKRLTIDRIYNKYQLSLLKGCSFFLMNCFLVKCDRTLKMFSIRKKCFFQVPRWIPEHHKSNRKKHYLQRPQLMANWTLRWAVNDASNEFQRPLGENITTFIGLEWK